MIGNPIRSIVIVGGGTAGWMTAAALSRFIDLQQTSIVLVESDSIGTVGVGEATIPHIRYFNEMLGIPENEFMRETNATYKLGIEFSNWGNLGDAYLHPFGIYGKDREGISFHHFWLKSRAMGNKLGISEYSLGAKAAYAEKFSYPGFDQDPYSSKFGYAFHIDAVLYAKYLRKMSEKKGIIRKEGKLVSVTKNSKNGEIESLLMDDGSEIKADFYIDCSGFRSLLLGDALGVEFEDWSYWLQCDRAVAVPSATVSPPTPYSKSIAREYGWQWRIPLQNRVGNGYVYSSKFINEEQAADKLLQNIDGKPLADINFLKFAPGRRKKSWEKNCVAIGLASGFLEPLESTSIYLIQLGIMKLLDFFPNQNNSSQLADEFNREMEIEYLRIRDFLILHYCITARNDTAFWNHCRTMDLPESLAYKINLFREMGEVEFYKKGLFLEPSWVAVYLGQGLLPKTYHPRADQFSESLSSDLSSIKDSIDGLLTKMTSHSASLANNCSMQSVDAWPPASMSLYGVFS
jgi:tryptophan 7-halogenase